jgi:hypothetical protein
MNSHEVIEQKWAEIAPALEGVGDSTLLKRIEEARLRGDVLWLAAVREHLAVRERLELAIDEDDEERHARMTGTFYPLVHEVERALSKTFAERVDLNDRVMAELFDDELEGVTN